jgi:hypothetical protein
MFSEQIFLNHPVSSVCSSQNVRNKVSHSYQTTGEITGFYISISRAYILERPNGRGNSGDFAAGGGIILKWILKETVWIGFIWLRIWPSS